MGSCLSTTKKEKVNKKKEENHPPKAIVQNIPSLKKIEQPQNEPNVQVSPKQIEQPSLQVAKKRSKKEEQPHQQGPEPQLLAKKRDLPPRQEKQLVQRQSESKFDQQVSKTTAQFMMQDNRKHSVVIRSKQQQQQQNNQQEIINQEDISLILDLSAQHINQNDSARKISSGMRNSHQRPNIFDSQKDKNSVVQLETDKRLSSSQSESIEVHIKKQKSGESQVAADNNENKEIILLKQAPYDVKANEEIFKKLALLKESQELNNDPQVNPLSPYKDRYEQYHNVIGDKVINIFHQAIINGNLPVIKYLVEINQINLALVFQIGQMNQNEYGEVRIKLDAMFTLKCALDSQSKEVFEYVLEIGTPFFSEELIQQFINLIQKNKAQYQDSHEYLNIILNSTLFKMWFVNQNYKGFNFQIVDNLCTQLGIQDPSKNLMLQDINESMVLEQNQEQEQVMSKDQQSYVEKINFCLKVVAQSKNKYQEGVNTSIIRLISNKKLSECQDEEILMKLVFSLHLIEFTKSDLDENMEKHIGSKNHISLINLLVKLNDVEDLKYVLQITRTNLKQALDIDSEYGTANCPLQNLFNNIIENQNMPLLRLLYEDPVISSKIIDEEVFFTIYELIIDNYVLSTIDYSEFLNFLVTSKTTHKIFKYLSFNERFTLIEQLLLQRGKVRDQLIEYVKLNIEESSQEAYFDEQWEKISNIFIKVYDILSDQPYSLYFFTVYPQVLQQMPQEGEDNKLMDILNRSRDCISDEDFELYIWQRSEFCLNLIQNMEDHGDSVTSSFDMAIIPFVMKLRQKCDQSLLKTYLKKKESITIQ